MICSNCRSEIGNQPVCPYCGRIQRVSNNGYTDPGQQKTVPVPQQTYYSSAVGPSGRSAISQLEQQISALDLRSKLSLVLGAGIFILQIITLIVLVLK